MCGEAHRKSQKLSPSFNLAENLLCLSSALNIQKYVSILLSTSKKVIIQKRQHAIIKYEVFTQGRFLVFKIRPTCTSGIGHVYGFVIKNKVLKKFDLVT